MIDTERYNIGGKAPQWSDEEIRILLEKYEYGTKSELMELIPNRTWSAIRCKAIQFGLKHKRMGDEAYIDRLNLSEFELGYIAGFIDGEGTISVTRQRNGNYLALHPLIRVSGTDKTAVEKMANWLNKSINGPYKLNVLEEERRKRNRKWKDYYSFEIRTWLGVFNVLEVIRDKLIIKKKQAELIHELCQIQLDNFGEEYTEREMELVEKVQELNKRGK